MVLIQHVREVYSQSNTGALAHHMLTQCELLRYGGSAGRFDASALLALGADCAVLYPLPGAPVLRREHAVGPEGAPRTLVILDGTWQQARRMSRRIPGLRSLSFVRLPADALPEWRLREPLEAGQLGTAEAIALALELLGEERAAERLRDGLELVARGVLRIRGKRAPAARAPHARKPRGTGS